MGGSQHEVVVLVTAVKAPLARVAFKRVDINIAILLGDIQGPIFCVHLPSGECTHQHIVNIFCGAEGNTDRCTWGHLGHGCAFCAPGVATEAVADSVLLTLLQVQLAIQQVLLIVGLLDCHRAQYRGRHTVTAVVVRGELYEINFVCNLLVWFVRVPPDPHV